MFGAQLFSQTILHSGACQDIYMPFQFHLIECFWGKKYIEPKPIFQSSIDAVSLPLWRLMGHKSDGVGETRSRVSRIKGGSVNHNTTEERHVIFQTL